MTRAFIALVALAASLAGGIARADDPPKKVLRYAFEVAYARLPSPEEIDGTMDFFKQATMEAMQKGANHDDATKQAAASFARVLWSSNEFLYMD